ncbi:LPS assembly lipoprotein LptE [Pseudaestuariivita rosea]|uniref:LPS assembly lipoprotein LptE n=1 Tax=Pseudaestuariivita rosea TaxID=2763263 RepID=UPI001ABB7374|nr:LPS assembly lipoprotein LptE [Pseudaestuariivita rosea]
MLFSRRLFVLGGLAALSGCGFAPVYGPAGEATKLRGRISFEEPTTRAAFDFVSQLEDRLGRPQSAAYMLSYTIETDETGVAVTSDQSTTRFNISGRIQYALSDVATGALLTDGDVMNFTSYSTTGTTVATQAAERDAYERLMTAMADQVVSQLIAASNDF